MGVTNITGVPTTVVKGGHYTLSSIVEPRNATNKTVVWTLNANGTGATINGAIINATAANMGSITATATIANGTNTGDYTQNFTISIVEVVDTVYTVAGVGIEMRSLPANTFVMGSTLDESSSTSMHAVTLSAFKMGKYEVTQEQFQAVMGYNPSDRGVSPDRPVHLISWSVAVAFCNKLSIAAGLQPVYDVPGITDWENFNYSHGSSIYYETALWSGATMDISKNGYRLPTEAEWDYAGRAGTTTEWINGNTVTAGLGLGAYAWYGENNASYTHHPVGGKLPNAFGLYDMQGSVYEWCWDWNGNYSSSPVTDPVGPESGVQFRITRGGSISAPASQLTSTYRLPTTLTTGMPQFGFRLVRR
ncbi:hypothetical protein FACS1894190_03610 [Spirochaetia bacterium]|nr:hypothetical protein FACS1894190_03610 [Spirochaetia bacterium]